MLLIGTMNWASTRMRGMFVCPECGTNQRFRLRSSRPFLTLYFIPVLPIGGIKEYVECGDCKSAFETAILSDHKLPSDAPESPQTELGPVSAPDQPSFESDLLHCIALIMIEDGQVSENEIRIGRRLFENISEQNLSRDELGQACSLVQAQRLTTTTFLATAGKRRTHEEKLLLVQAMFGVAGADGELTPGRLHSLAEAQQRLEIDEQEFQMAIKATEQWLT